MKIFSTSDIHGNKEALEKIVHFLNSRKDIDIVVFCGDLSPEYSHTSIRELAKFQKKDYLSFKSSIEKIVNKKGYFIKGNHDVFLVDSSDSNYLKKPIDINEYQKLIPFEMVSGRFYGTNREGTEDDLRRELSDVDINENSIIIAHQPPYGILDKGSNGYWCGSSAVKEMIYSRKPYIYICGHIHEAFGVEMKGSTLVVNCACLKNTTRGWIIDIETRQCEKIIL